MSLRKSSYLTLQELIRGIISLFLLYEKLISISNKIPSNVSFKQQNLDIIAKVSSHSSQIW